jgi:hypothetical protein
MNVALVMCQNALAVKPSRHYTCAGASPSPVDANGLRELSHPSFRHSVLHHRHQHLDGGETSRPRKRSDGGVVRLRQPSTGDEKLKCWLCSEPAEQAQPCAKTGQKCSTPLHSAHRGVPRRRDHDRKQRQLVESGIGQQRLVKS